MSRSGRMQPSPSRRPDVSPNLIRVWVAKYGSGASDDEFQAADLLQQYEAKIAALERLVGRQALEIEWRSSSSRGLRKTDHRREARVLRGKLGRSLRQRSAGG